MICPHAERECMRADICQLLPCKPPKPTMAEIERLVDALVDAALYDDIPDAQAARAALLAAIRAYGEGE